MKVTVIRKGKFENKILNKSMRKTVQLLKFVASCEKPSSASAEMRMK